MPCVHTNALHVLPTGSLRTPRVDAEAVGCLPRGDAKMQVRIRNSWPATLELGKRAYRYCKPSTDPLILRPRRGARGEILDDDRARGSQEGEELSEGRTTLSANDDIVSAAACAIVQDSGGAVLVGG